MTTDGVTTPVGTRVTLRYRLPPGHSHPMTDVIGELVEASDTLVAVRASDGRVVQISPDRVVALKPLGPKPVRTSEIRALERTAADGWPGVEQHWIDGWLLRAGHGFTGRANSAVPLEPHASEDALGDIERWFRARSLPPTLLLPDRLGRVPAGWTVRDETLVMAADISSMPLPDQRMATISDAPNDGWLALYRYRGRPMPDGAAEVVSAVREGIAGFARIGSTTDVLAIGRGAVTAGWVGLTAIEVAEPHRRNGLGTRICGELTQWGREHGATRAYVQVAAENAGAIAMYRDLGFVEHHRYRYAYVTENT